jgi:hypothetical protein
MHTCVPFQSELVRKDTDLRWVQSPAVAKRPKGPMTLGVLVITLGRDTLSESDIKEGSPFLIPAQSAEREKHAREEFTFRQVPYRLVKTRSFFVVCIPLDELSSDTGILSTGSHPAQEEPFSFYSHSCMNLAEVQCTLIIVP